MPAANMSVPFYLNPLLPADDDDDDDGGDQGTTPRRFTDLLENVPSASTTPSRRGMGVEVPPRPQPPSRLWYQPQESQLQLQLQLQQLQQNQQQQQHQQQRQQLQQQLSLHQLHQHHQQQQRLHQPHHQQLQHQLQHHQPHQHQHQHQHQLQQQYSMNFGEPAPWQRPNDQPRRATGVCEHCRKRKVRCDGSWPCSTCQDARRICVYPVSAQRPTARDPTADDSEGGRPVRQKCLDRLDAKVGKLAKQVADLEAIMGSFVKKLDQIQVEPRRGGVVIVAEKS